MVHCVASTRTPHSHLNRLATRQSAQGSPRGGSVHDPHPTPSFKSLCGSKVNCVFRRSLTVAWKGTYLESAWVGGRLGEVVASGLAARSLAVVSHRFEFELAVPGDVKPLLCGNTSKLEAHRPANRAIAFLPTCKSIVRIPTSLQQSLAASSSWGTHSSLDEGGADHEQTGYVAPDYSTTD